MVPDVTMDPCISEVPKKLEIQSNSGEVCEYKVIQEKKIKAFHILGICSVMCLKSPVGLGEDGPGFS